MKLSISNIGWDKIDDNAIYTQMKELGYTGLEIAPTRVYENAPYDSIEEAQQWSGKLRSEWGLDVVSMQSIWFGRKENIFANAQERNSLIEYTRKAIVFAEAIGCPNLVFGCPKNRDVQVEKDGNQWNTAVSFFRTIGEIADQHHTCIAMEANPPIYNTRFINTTAHAVDLVKEVKCSGFKINLDLGAIIYNDEPLKIIADNIDLINHIHISEPFLIPISKEHEKLHRDLLDIIIELKYKHYVSIEMKRPENISEVYASLDYIYKLFNERTKE